MICTYKMEKLDDIYGNQNPKYMKEDENMYTGDADVAGDTGDTDVAVDGEMAEEVDEDIANLENEYTSEEQPQTATIGNTETNEPSQDPKFIIKRPRRRENGTYTSNIYASLNPNTSYYFTFENALIVKVSDLSEAEKYVYIKDGRKNMSALHDLNQQVIKIVQENCDTWFENRMNSKIIEEYYVNSIIYDKKHGYLIRLKVVDVDDDLSMNVGNRILLKLAMKNLRFYKQKFFVEWTVREMREAVYEPHDKEDNHALQQLPMGEYEEELLQKERKRMHTKIVNIQSMYLQMIDAQMQEWKKMREYIVSLSEEQN